MQLWRSMQCGRGVSPIGCALGLTAGTLGDAPRFFLIVRALSTGVCEVAHNASEI
jgi:hypothetical protein